MTAKTPAQRQQAMRFRRSVEGLAEVRGIYLPPTLHPELKRTAKRLINEALLRDKGK